MNPLRSFFEFGVNFWGFFLFFPVCFFCWKTCWWVTLFCCCWWCCCRHCTFLQGEAQPAATRQWGSELRGVQGVFPPRVRWHSSAKQLFNVVIVATFTSCSAFVSRFYFPDVKIDWAHQLVFDQFVALASCLWGKATWLWKNNLGDTWASCRKVERCRAFTWLMWWSTRWYVFNLSPEALICKMSFDLFFWQESRVINVHN